jgi:cytoskeletal protein CcmA (bactofilin family)
MEPDRATLVDENCEFQGKLQGKDARVLGKFRGEIELSGRLTTGEGSKLEARLRADVAEISGEFHGEIVARSLTLTEKARVDGTIQADVLVVREGAFLQAAVNASGHARPAEVRAELAFGQRPPLKGAAAS